MWVGYSLHQLLRYMAAHSGWHLLLPVRGGLLAGGGSRTGSKFVKWLLPVKGKAAFLSQGKLRAACVNWGLVGRQKHVALHRRIASADFCVLEQPGLCVGLLYSAAGQFKYLAVYLNSNEPPSAFCGCNSA